MRNFPAFPVSNSRNGWLCNPERLSDLAMRKLGFDKHPDHRDLFIGQSSIGILFTKFRFPNPLLMEMRVTKVVTSGQVFKVVESITGLVEVFVANVESLWARANEGFAYKGMNSMALLIKELNQKVAVAVLDRGQKNRERLVDIAPLFRLVNTLYATQRGNFVKALKPNDRAPFFVHFDLQMFKETFYA